MTRVKKHFPLRLDPQIYNALEKWSQDELRSVNAHIEYLLRKALQQAGRLPVHSKDTMDTSDTAPV